MLINKLYTGVGSYPQLGGMSVLISEPNINWPTTLMLEGPTDTLPSPSLSLGAWFHVMGMVSEDG